MIDHAKLKAALKTLDSAPKAIDAAKARYRTKMQEIKEMEASGKYAPLNIKTAKTEAQRERDRTVKALAESMLPALETVKRNNDYTGEQIALDDPKFTNALNVISLLGKNVPLSTQASILSQFRGNPAALSVLEQAYKKNNLYMHTTAHEMQKPVSAAAIDDMETALSYYVYNAQKGIYDFDTTKCHWTQHEFGEQAERLGYDTSAESPYAYALAEESRRLEAEQFTELDDKERVRNRAQLYAVQKAQRDLTNARTSGGDEAAVFEAALRQVERLATPAAPATPTPANE